MMVMSISGPMKKRKLSTVCYTSAKLLLIILVVVNDTIRLLILFVLNNTNVAIIIKYQIIVDNTSSNYTKTNFRSSFLGYSPNGNCVIALSGKLTE